MSLDFNAFSRLNRERCESPRGFNHALTAWSSDDWMTAVIGEVGEAANLIKKLNRVRDGIPGNGYVLADDLKFRLGRELADVFIYADLLMQRLDVGAEWIQYPVVGGRAGVYFSQLSQRAHVATLAPPGTPAHWLLRLTCCIGEASRLIWLYPDQSVLIAGSLADAFICLAQLFAAFGIDGETAIVDTFNAVSLRMGYPVFIRPDGSVRELESERPVGLVLPLATGPARHLPAPVVTSETPWTIEGIFDDGVSVDIVSGDGKRVCEIYPSGVGDTWLDSDIGNVKSVVSAPMLHASLRRALAGDPGWQAEAEALVVSLAAPESSGVAA